MGEIMELRERRRESEVWTLSPSLPTMEEVPEDGTFSFAK